MLVPMAKVEILGPKSLFSDVVSTLHEQGRIHIEDLTNKIKSGEVAIERMENQGEEVKTYDELDELLIRVRAILRSLPEPGRTADPRARTQEYERLGHLDPTELCDEIRLLVRQIEDRVAELATQSSSAETEIALLARYEPILAKIQPLARQLVVTGSYDSVALLVERRYKAGLEQLQAELDRLTNSQSEVLSTDIDEATTAAIVVFARQYAEQVHKFLAMENVNQIRLPEDFQDMPLDVAYQTIRQRRSELPAELEKCRAELSALSREWYVKLASARDVLVDRIEEIVAIPQFGRTEYVFMIDGWIPVHDLTPMKKLLQERFKDQLIVTQLQITQKDFGEAPVALDNPRWAKPYETLMGFMGTPEYGTYDPTWMLAIFYPLFFGMIVGDIGYGAIMLGTVIWLRMRYKANANVQVATAILGPAATSAIIFGFIYGEFFGLELPKLDPRFQAPTLAINGMQVLPFERTATEMIRPLMYIALAIGVFQVVLGLGLGVYNGIRTKHWSSVYERGGMLAFVIGFIVLMLGVLGATALEGASPVVQAVGGLAVFLGLISAIKGGKILGAIESISALANIASYLRIMAVGLAGAIFAKAVNDMAIGKSLVLALLIVIPLQVLNFAIISFSPNIHAVRLNFLEFFGKFYETGTKEYKPFHKTGGKKKDE